MNPIFLKNRSITSFHCGAAFFEKVAIGVLVFTFGCLLLWSAASGPILPHWDDWRYLLNYSVNVFGNFNVFKAQNDTLSVIPVLLDVMVFKVTNFNFAFARFFSLVWLLIFGWFAISALRVIYSGYMRAAAILLLLLALAVKGYWDDGTYIAYHQGLPLVFCMVSFYVALHAVTHRRVSFGQMFFITLLSLASGLTYISGFIPVVGIGCAFLVASFSDKTKNFFTAGLGRFGIFLILLALAMLAFQFSMVSAAQGSLLEKSHASPVVTPLDFRFWIFFLGIVGKGFGFRGVSIGIDALITIVIFGPWIVLVFQVIAKKTVVREDVSYGYMLIAYTYASATILVYAAMVAYGRGGLLPADNYYVASAVAKARFHHWWISALSPLLISGIVLLGWSKFNFRYLQLTFFIVCASALAGLFSFGLWSFEKNFVSQKNRELLGIACVRENIDREVISCKDFFPSDMKPAVDLAMDKKLWIADVLRGGGGEQWQKGSVVDVTSVVEGGHVDSIEVVGKNVKIIGWVPLNPAEPGVSLYVRQRLGDVGVSEYRAEIIKRPDVAVVFKDDKLINSGFSIAFKTSRNLDVDFVKRNFCVNGVKDARAVIPVYADNYYCK